MTTALVLDRAEPGNPERVYLARVGTIHTTAGGESVRVYRIMGDGIANRIGRTVPAKWIVTSWAGQPDKGDVRRILHTVRRIDPQPGAEIAAETIRQAIRRQRLI